MAEFESTSQYAIKFKGNTSKPYVLEPPIVNEENPEYVDLHLAGPTSFSENIEDYTVHHKGNEIKVIKIKGNVLTVQHQL